MNNQVIISISREFGSGGHEISEKIAEKLGIELVDRGILATVAEKMHMAIKDVEKYDEKPRNIILSRRVNGFSNSIEENIAEMQFDILRKKASDGESFVVVGRCAEAVLAGNPNLITIFVQADDDARLERVSKKYEISEDEAKSKINRHDKSRKSYHNDHCDSKWGDVDAYDLCINSTRLGVDGTADVLVDYIKARMK